MDGKQAAERRQGADSETWRTRLEAVRRAEIPRLALWTPVAIGLGVALSFSSSNPPSLAVLSGVATLLALATLAAVGLARIDGFGASAARIGAIALALAALGALAAERRIAAVQAPVWPAELRGERGVSGRVLAVLPRRGDATRLRLDRLEIEGLAPEATPERLDVRLAAGVLSDHRALAMIDRRVGLRARLFGPPGPAEPGAFDYRFRAWFLRVGALGVQGGGPAATLRDLGSARVAGPLDAWRGAVARARASIAERARLAAPGVEGAVIAALLVGDRSGLPEESLQALRDSNLAHLLAISGLHMALVCVTVFATLRLLLALPIRAPLGLSPKKTAALGALRAGAVYLQLSGGGTPPERAFVMVAVAFGAILADRPAVTLRAVALAATLLLLLRPESLYDAGFQLSFAATTAMVAVFEATRGVWRRERTASRPRLVALWAGALVVSSLTAGLATAPFAALAFNRGARYGLLANLAAAPAMGLFIMPLGVGALALTPLGLDGPLYALMAHGVGYVLLVAEIAAGAPGATWAVAAAPPSAPALIALGGLFLCLWRSAGLKAIGLAPLLAAALLWRAHDRPDLLISRSGGLLGVETAEGRAFDRHPNRRAYAARLWLRRDGDAADLDEAAARRLFVSIKGGRVAALPGGWRAVRFARRKVAIDRVRAQCRPRTVLVLTRARLSAGEEERHALSDCVILDADALATGGAVAIWTEPELRALTAMEAAPARPWTQAR